MEAQAAVDNLKEYFLGSDWYDVSGATDTEQINTNIVAEIEQKYRGAKTGWFKRNKFDVNHIWNICDSEGWEGCILSPPMNAQVAVNGLCRYFLGDYWCDSSGKSNILQVNAAIVYVIKNKYKGCKNKYRRRK